MPATQTQIPGLSSEGLVSMRVLRRAAKSGSSQAFVTTYPAPALHVVDIKVGAASGNPDVTVQPGLQLRALMNPSRSAFRYLDEVAFVAKRVGATFDPVISLGRSPDNDIVLAVESVSHAHAGLACVGGRWLLTDRGSKNGTRLNGESVPAFTPVPLSSGDKLLFGGEIAAVFLTPEALFEKAQQ